MISADFSYFLKKQGPVSGQTCVNPTYAESFRGRLPASLLNFWAEHGWGSYAGGMLKVCDPGRFTSVLHLILKSDKDLNPDRCSVFAFSVFGRLFAWHPEHRAFSVNLLDHQLAANMLLNPAKKINEDQEIATYLVTFNKARNDVSDGSNKPMYDRAIKTLGQPGLDECFGFVPALVLGGERSLRNLKRLKAVEHFAILAELQSVQLMDFGSFPPRPIRAIG